MAPPPPSVRFGARAASTHPSFAEGLALLVEGAPEGLREGWSKLLTAVAALGSRDVLVHLDDGPPATMTISCADWTLGPAWCGAHASMVDAVERSRLTVEVTGSAADGHATLRLLKPRLMLVR